MAVTDREQGTQLAPHAGPQQAEPRNRHRERQGARDEAAAELVRDEIDGTECGEAQDQHHRPGQRERQRDAERRAHHQPGADRAAPGAAHASTPST
jgi:hypothetical protein